MQNMIKKIFGKKERQMSDTIEIGIVLALAGGFMDAYSYICRGEVFANAQTGNMLLLGVNLSEGKWLEAIRYLFPVLAFMFGITLADLVRLRLTEDSKFLHWRQIALICEALVLVIVSFLPLSQNLLANSMTSFACGIQVESFRKIHGNGIATTMCIGNLRSATQNICEYWHTRDKKLVKRGFLYYGIILCFILGAILGNEVIKQMGSKAIVGCSGILFVAFLMMFADKDA